MNRWVKFNDTVVKEVVDGWPEIVHDCLTGKAYPTVLVYERCDSEHVSQAPFADFSWTHDIVKNFVEMTKPEQDDFFSDSNAEEQRRLFE